ncbi:MAG: ThiF family adenylyltransferase [Candidatus Aenigmatarchaeota archaeon]
MMAINDRYSRQIVYFGEKNQTKLFKAKISIVGCGATGSVVSSLLVRAGIGSIKIIDRDFVDLSNLQRTELFTEEDIGKPKAEAAKERLAQINPEIKIESITDDLRQNPELLKSDLIIDCTDNMETRHLINEFAVKNSIPWIYGGAIGEEGMSVSFFGTPCLKCLFPRESRGQLETCETLGILSPTSHIIGSWQASEATKILTGKTKFGVLFNFSTKEPRFDFSKIKQNKNCSVCSQKKFDHLENVTVEKITVLCGQNKYQIIPQKKMKINLIELENKLKRNPSYKIKSNKFLIHIQNKKNKMSLFENSRAIVEAKSEKEANNFYNLIVSS